MFSESSLSSESIAKALDPELVNMRADVDCIRYRATKIRQHHLGRYREGTGESGEDCDPNEPNEVEDEIVV